MSEREKDTFSSQIKQKENHSLHEHRFSRSPVLPVQFQKILKLYLFWGVGELLTSTKFIACINQVLFFSDEQKVLITGPNVQIKTKPPYNVSAAVKIESFPIFFNNFPIRVIIFQKSNIRICLHVIQTWFDSIFTTFGKLLTSIIICFLDSKISVTTGTSLAQ